ncbi:hypothetical protein ABIE51_001450 [Lysobacter sp. OAE881]
MTKAELAEKHGTPAQFESAVWAAWAQLFIETDEAHAAIEKYNAEWERAA